MNRLLNALGLMTRAEHERAKLRIADGYSECVTALTEDRDEKLSDWEAKYKKAITDLAAARDEIAMLGDALKTRTELVDAVEANNTIKDRVISDLNETIESLRPDALAMRRKRAMDRDRKKGKVA